VVGYSGGLLSESIELFTLESWILWFFSMS